MKRTVLFAAHQRLGARMTEFGGFEMPVQYSGIIEEHRAVRSAAGVFDLSHMGEFEIAGPHALELLEHALTNSAARLRDGQAQYTIMCAQDGGTIDDLIVYKLGERRYLLCVNASNIEQDREWLLAHNRCGAEFRDLSDETALVAIQGPKALTIASAIASAPLASIRRFGVAEVSVAGVRCIAARTGYTGEDGFEFFIAPRDAERLFTALIEAGSKDGTVACGLGARDTLRLEAALPLYGHELDRSISPLEAGLETYIRLGRGFIGEEALAAHKAAGIGRRRIGLVTDDGRTIARQGYRIFSAGAEIGAVTSGTFAPSLNRPIAMAFARAPIAVGERIEVEVRNRRVPATVTAMPFYKAGA